MIARSGSLVRNLGIAFLALGFLAACSRSSQTVLPAEPIDTGDKAGILTPTTAEEAESNRTPLATRALLSTPSSPVQVASLPAYPVMGIELYKVSPEGGADLVKQAGAFWTRRNALLWSEVEPEQGKRNWEALSGLEQEMIAASERGLQLILVVRSTPGWAQVAKDLKCGPIAPGKLNDFGAFMFDAVQRYSVPPYNVMYWELGNEPDISLFGINPESEFGCWGDPDNPYYGGTYYAEMLKAVYPRIKAANSQAQVLVGGLLLDCDPTNPPEAAPGSGKQKNCSPSRYLEGVLISGGGDYFDGVSFHAYDYYQGRMGEYSNANWHSAWNTTGPVLIAKAQYLRELLVRNGYPDKLLINTELALLCGSDGSEPECQTEAFENTKASYVAQAFSSTAAERLGGSLWYALLGWRGSGLVSAGLQPLPAYDAFAAAASFLEGAAFTNQVLDYPGVMGYEFERDGKRQWVLWSLDGQDHLIHLDELPNAMLATGGETLSPAQDITVSLAPVYIIW